MNQMTDCEDQLEVLRRQIIIQILLTIWVPMLSHALVDVAVFGVGGIILLT